MSIWFEDFSLKMPERSGAGAASVLLDDGANNGNKMYPYECRLRSLTY